EAEVFDGLRVEGIDEGDVEAGVVELDGERAVKAGGSGGDEGEHGFGRCPIPEVHHGGSEFGGDDRPDVVSVVDDLEVGEDLGDLLAAVIDFVDDVLRERAINEAAGLEKFDELVVVHAGV